MIIRPPKYEEIENLREFPPPDWNFDIEFIMHLHWNSNYFMPVVAEINNKLAAVAFAIKNGDVAWLGGIIVLNRYRKQGIGKAITKHLIEQMQAKRCESLVLMATELGKPVYEKLGFKTSSYYAFMEGRKISQTKNNIRKASQADTEQIFNLDFIATGESRKPFLEKYLKGAWVCGNNEIEGFHLPAFDQGLIIAKNDNAGLALLQLKHSFRNTTEVLPVENKSAIELLNQHGFTSTKKAPRMYLGKEANWKPQMIYARAGGYCG